MQTKLAIAITLLLCIIQAALSQNLIVNQQSNTLLRATIPNQITVAIDSSYLPTIGYALLSNASSSGGSGGSGTTGGSGNSIGDLKQARAVKQSVSYNGALSNLMFVYQLQHVWELSSNSRNWEEFIVGNDTALSNTISQWNLAVNNQSGNVATLNPDVVPFSFRSGDNFNLNGVVTRNNLINAFNGAVNPAVSDFDDVSASASVNTGSNNNEGSNSNANVATSKKRSVKQNSNNNFIGLRPVVQLNTVMNQSFIGNLNPATRFIAHCYKASILDLNNGNEQNAVVVTPISNTQAAGIAATTSGISASASSFNINRNVLGGSNNSMIAFVSPQFTNTFAELAYLRAVPQNINLANNPLAGTLVTVQRGNLDTSMICVIVPRSNSSSLIYNLEMGYVNNANAVGAFTSDASSYSSFKWFSSLVIALAMLFFAL